MKLRSGKPIGIDKYVGITGTKLGRMPGLWTLESYLAPGFGRVSLIFRFGRKIPDLLLSVQYYQDEAFKREILDGIFKLNIPLTKFTMWNKCLWLAFGDGVDFAKYIDSEKTDNEKFNSWIKKIDARFAEEKARGKWNTFEFYNTSFVTAGIREKFTWTQDLLDLGRELRTKKERKPLEPELRSIEELLRIGDENRSRWKRSGRGLPTSYGAKKIREQNAEQTKNTITSLSERSKNES